MNWNEIKNEEWWSDEQVMSDEHEEQWNIKEAASPECIGV